MKTVYIKIEFPDDFAELLDHPDGVMLCEPVTVQELAHFRQAIAALDGFHGFSARAFRQIKEILETKPDAARHIRDLVEQMVSPALAAEAAFKDVMVLFARAVAVPTDKRPPKTKGKGRVL